MVHIFRTPTPKAGRSVTFASSPVKSDGRLLGPTNLKSASKGANPDAFDANVDHPAELGASPVPPDTPTHPALYKGALAYGSPKKSKLPSRVRYIPSPTTTPDDDQDLPNNKKKRRTSEKGPAYFDVCKLTSDDIDDIIEEDRNLHPDERKQQAFAAPPQQDTKVSHRATSTTKKAAKMQTTTTTTTMDNYYNKMGETTNKNGPTTLPAASTNVMSNNIGPTDVFTTEEHTTTAAKRRTNPNEHNVIDLTDDTNDLKTPQKAPNSPPTLTYKSRANTPSIPTAKVTTLTNFAQPAHNPIFQAPGLPQPESTCQGESKEPPTLIHPSHPGLESEIATFTHRIASFGYTPTLTEFTGFLQHHEDLEDLVIIAIKMTGDEQLMPILDLLILVRSVIGQRNSHSVPPAHRMVDILAKFERIPTDGSREMTVQNFPSPPRVLVDVDNSAASRTKTMTCHDRSAELGTRNFCAETPDSVQTPFASAPQSPTTAVFTVRVILRHRPRVPTSMTILPMTHPLDHFPSPLRLPMTRLISTLCPLCTTRPLTAEEKALESYCDDDDTVEFTVVDVLPEVEIMPEPMIIESIEEEFVEETATNPILEALNELPKAATQQPVRMLPHFFLNRP
ncbi:hypothetical protein MHU86_18884 [Fragilaria crotonensis]|nr:hypothetical protein MHU86_18884 [Fragilaria crotonensis]